MSNIKELRKEFPKGKYFLIRRTKPLSKFGVFKFKCYKVAIYSPATKGAKQPVEYYKFR